MPDGREYIETLPRIGYRLAPSAFAYVAKDLLELQNEDQTSTLLLVPDASIYETVAAPSFEAERSIKQDWSTAPSYSRFRVHLSSLVVIFFFFFVSLLVLYFYFSSESPRVLRSVAVTNDGTPKPAYAPLLLDGSRVFFTEILANQMYLAEASSLGGSMTRHLSPGSTGEGVGISPGGGEVIFASPWEGGQDPPLMAMSVGNQTNRQVGGLRGHGAVWSPDGKRLVVTQGRELLLADEAGEEVRVLARLPDVPFWPAWSPDGRRIRFSRQQGATRQSLWEISAEGGPVRPLFEGTSKEFQVCCGSWSPDGRYFIYVFDQGDRSALWVRSESGLSKIGLRSNEHELASGPVRYWRSPAIGADGHVYAVGEQARGEMVRLTPRGTAMYDRFLDGLSADTVTYSHDGAWIAYSLYPEGTLWKSRPDGSDRVQLSQPGRLVRMPQWSPDDRTIVFLSSVGGRPRAIQEIAASGGAVRTLVEDGLSQGAASYSPDGKKVAYSLTVEFGVAPARLTFINLVDRASGRVEKLAGSDGLWKARWSADPNYLAAVSTDRSRLMLYDFRLQSWSTLADLGVNDLIWSNDGKALYFDTRSGTDPFLYKVTIANRKIEKVADLKGLQRASFFGSHLSISPTEDILMLRDVGDSEVYRFDVSFP